MRSDNSKVSRKGNRVLDLDFLLRANGLIPFGEALTNECLGKTFQVTGPVDCPEPFRDFMLHRHVIQVQPPSILHLLRQRCTVTARSFPVIHSALADVAAGPLLTSLRLVGLDEGPANQRLSTQAR